MTPEPVCVGPFCSLFATTAPGKTGNSGILSAIGSTIGTLIQWLVIVAGLLMLLYLLWGALDWITSGGDKEKIEKAQHKITQAVIGILLVIVVLSIYGLVAGDLLGIIIKNPDGSWSFKIPLLTPQ